jgi:sulfur carrier protein ThiS
MGIMVKSRRNSMRRSSAGERSMVQIIYRDKTWEVKPGSTVRHIIEQAGLNPESILAVRDGKLINDATLIHDGDTIKLVSVVSGGY